MIRVFIADRHRIYREGVKNAIKNSNIKVIGEAANEKELIEGLENHSVDILITDYILESEKAEDFLPKIIQLFPNLKILMLTMSSSKESLLKYIKYLSGFISKGTTAEHIDTTIKFIASGGNYYCIPNSRL